MCVHTPAAVLGAGNIVKKPVFLWRTLVGWHYCLVITAIDLRDPRIPVCSNCCISPPRQDSQSHSSFINRSPGNLAIAHRNGSPGKSKVWAWVFPSQWLVCNAIYWHLVCSQIHLIEFPPIMRPENWSTATVFTKAYFSPKSA